ncbi:DoxX family protein [Lysobacter sp. K5869]|uniref:DoxX family protein n=1 Tax=Lysobacter sp. K5869 TaxID=2820808 RepID=UPI001C0620B2|nr:DoxX family protein [Lysobacter sp. K5869]QWP78971.1 DoxX family protein [Lysobacter sp. K5869]
MNPNLLPAALLLARLLMSSIFLISGLSKLSHPDAVAAYMQASGVPAALLWPTVAFELAAAALLIAGFATRATGALLAGFCVVTALLFHANLGDQIQQLMFLKNLVMAGGFLALAVAGAGRWSLDGRRS